MKLTPEEKARVIKALGVDDVGDDEAVTQLTAAIDGLRTQLGDSEAQVKTLSAAKPAPDPEILRDRADITLDRIDVAINKGDLPKSIGDKIRKAVSPAGKPNVFMLSRSDAIDARPVDFVLGLFTGEKLGIETGEVTTIQLSRNVPGEKEVDAEVAKGKAQGEAFRDAQLASRSK